MNTRHKRTGKNKMSELKVVIVPQKVALADGSSVIMYCAICLDHFIVGEGRTAKQAMNELQRSIIGTIAANKTIKQARFFGVKAAPERYQALLGRGEVASGMDIQDAVDGYSFTLKPVLLPSSSAA
jgi:hypothetical protein